MTLDHTEASPEVAAFLAAGGEVTKLAPGEMNWDSLTNKRRSNPCMAILPKEPLIERPPEPKRLRKPAAPKVRVHNGPRIARPGTQKARILVLLEAGSLRTAEVAQLLGVGRNHACVALTALREAGLVVSTGGKANMRWAKA